MPILPMFECIRHQLMDWYTEWHTNELNTTGSLVSKIARQIQASINDRARRYRFLSSNNVNYEVQSSISKKDYLVNLRDQTCSCHNWQSKGFPCGHALAIILSHNEDPQIYTKSFFSLEAYRNTYKNSILHPLVGDYSLPLAQAEIDTSSTESDSDSDDIVIPPNTRRPVGRP